MDPRDDAESILARFLDGHPKPSAAAFDAWAREQPELVENPELRDRVEHLRGLVTRLTPMLGSDPASGTSPASGFFHQGAVPPVPAHLPSTSHSPGERVGSFELRRFLAEGGMGQVWEAFDTDLRRLVALKFVRQDRVDSRSLERFAREARAGGRLAHPNVVLTLGFHNSADGAWIAQELIEGSWTLKDFLDEIRSQDALPEGYYRKVAELVAEIANGLQAAHEAGVVHRDVKPQNILIAPDDTPKLTDFGLARVNDDSFLSVTGEFAGTYAYMSPEQVTAKRIGLDHRTDVFSLGVVMYELLSLRRPFDGDTTHQISQRILFFEPPSPSRIRSQCPQELSVVCGKALEKDPQRRFKTMAEFASELRRFLSNEPIHTKPPGSLVRMAKWARRNPGPSSAAGVGLLSLGVISSVLYQQVQTSRNLKQSNADLETQTLLAKTNAEDAQLARDLAVSMTSDMLALSSQITLEGLIDESSTLWPAHPELTADLEGWIKLAKELIDGRPADDAQGRRKQPSLAEHKEQLEILRERAIPLTPEQALAQQITHPLYAELLMKRGEALWRSRMLGLDRWPENVSLESEFAKDTLAGGASDLNDLAWRLVGPERSEYGREVQGLLLARRAFSLAAEEELWAVGDTLSWALFRVGRLEEAIIEAQAAASDQDESSMEESLLPLMHEVERWRGSELALRRAELDTIYEEIDGLVPVVSRRNSFEFTDPIDAWWHRHRSKMVSDLERLADPSQGLMGNTVAPPFGWGIIKRLQFAETIADRSVSGSLASQLWSKATAAVQSTEVYGGLRLSPQLGLVPIGSDPESGLWEFAHLQTGVPATRGSDGRLVLNEDTGLVFVLIPGGKFWMGSQSSSALARNHDPLGQLDEGPVHEVELSPYFLSKFEMTQGQWQRITADDPSLYGPNNYTTFWSQEGKGWSALHPVEQVSWNRCMEIMDRMALSLPTEAQWEYAARAGTDSIYAYGDDLADLWGAANLLDSYAKNHGMELSPTWEKELDDGHSVHAPVGSYEPNAFGLHDVHGNVWEWCLDGFDRAYYERSPKKDPLSPWAIQRTRVKRGGGYFHIGSSARVAFRDGGAPDSITSSLGLRPARALDHPAPPDAASD